MAVTLYSLLKIICNALQKFHYLKHNKIYEKKNEYEKKYISVTLMSMS